MWSCPPGRPGTENAHPGTDHGTETGGTVWTAGRTPAGEMTGTWGTSEDQTPVDHYTQPPPVSLTYYSIYNNLMSSQSLPWPVCSPACLLPLLSLTENAADPECTWNIVWIKFKATRYMRRMHWMNEISYWSAVECIVIPTSLIWLLSVSNTPTVLLNYPTMTPNRKSQFKLMVCWIEA